MFNNPESACRTCGGLGVHKLTHPELLVPDPRRSILGGCFVREAFKYNPDTWDGRMMYSLSKTLRFSLDTPWEKLPETVRQRDTERDRREDRAFAAAGSQGEARRIGGQGGGLRRNRSPHRAALPPLPAARRSQLGMEAWLDKVMVEHTCPDCKGARVRATRLLFTIAGKTIHDFGQLNFDELHAFLGTVKPAGRGADAGRQVLAKFAAGWNCCWASGWIISASIAGRARFPAANRSASGCPRRSVRG